jgi:hypothetical protein
MSADTTPVGKSADTVGKSADTDTVGTSADTAAVGKSETVSADDRLWRDATAELTPARSLARIDDHAKQVLGTISVVGTLLTGLGLIAGTRLEHSTVGRWLAIAAVGAAALAVVVAWWYQLLRLTAGFRPGNLIDVKHWYEQQFRRAYGVWAAGVLLLVAIVLAATGAMVVLAAGPPPG